MLAIRNVFKKILCLFCVINIMILCSCTTEPNVEDQIDEQVEQQEIATDKRGYKITARETIKIRKNPTVASSQVGKMNEGTTLIATESTSSGQYTWYELGPDEWVADDGTWLTVSSIAIKNESTIRSEVLYSIRAKKEIDIYKFPSLLEKDPVGKLSKTTYLNVYEELFDGRDTWYRIGEDEWIRVVSGTFKYEK